MSHDTKTIAELIGTLIEDEAAVIEVVDDAAAVGEGHALGLIDRATGTRYGVMVVELS